MSEILYKYSAKNSNREIEEFNEMGDLDNIRDIFSNPIEENKNMIDVSCILSSILYLYEKDYKGIMLDLGVPDDKYKLYNIDDTLVFGIFSFGKKKILTFKGSSSINDFYTNIDIRQTRANKYISGKIHNGFYDLLFGNCIETPELTRCDVVFKLLLDVIDDDDDIIISGHSLGAALATVFTSYIENKLSYKVWLITLGSPRIGNRKFCKSIKSKVTRIVNDDDIVTQLPLPFRYSHVGEKIVIGESKCFQLQPFSMKEHNIREYFKSLNNAAEINFS